MGTKCLHIRGQNSHLDFLIGFPCAPEILVLSVKCASGEMMEYVPALLVTPDCRGAGQLVEAEQTAWKWLFSAQEE